MHPRSYRLIFPEPATSFPGSSATPSVLRVRPASPPPKGPGFARRRSNFRPRELWIAAHVPQLPLLAIATAESGAATSSAPLVVVDDGGSQSAHHRRGCERAGGRSAGRHDAGRRVRARSSSRCAAARCGARTRAHAAAGRHRRHVHAAGVHRAAGWPAARDQAEHPSVRRLARVVPPVARCLPCRSGVARSGGAATLHARSHRIGCARGGAGRRALFHHRSAPVAGAAQTTAARRRCAGRKKKTRVCSAMGVRTLGELMRLPRAGFAKRFGVERLCRSRSPARASCRSAPPPRAARAISRTPRSRS